MCFNENLLSYLCKVQQYFCKHTYIIWSNIGIWCFPEEWSTFIRLNGTSFQKTSHYNYCEYSCTNSISWIFSIVCTEGDSSAAIKVKTSMAGFINLVYGILQFYRKIFLANFWMIQKQIHILICLIKGNSIHFIQTCKSNHEVEYFIAGNKHRISGKGAQIITVLDLKIIGLFCKECGDFLIICKPCSKRCNTFCSCMMHIGKPGVLGQKESDKLACQFVLKCFCFPVWVTGEHRP